LIRTLFLIGVSVLAASAGAAQSPEPPRLIIPRVARPPQLSDFLTMDAGDAPGSMRRIEGFVQRFPNDGEAVSERTVVYIGYDDEFLYVAFQCFDAEPSKIGAHVLPRDAFPNDEDTVAVHIDTFRDLKHAYGFQTNAYGVQTDGIYTEGTGWDLSWDTVWKSDARPTSSGYAVLVSIPFRSLRFPAADAQQWGMFFYRGIPRKNEQVFWPACSTRIGARFRQAALVSGVDHVSPGHNVQAIPYVSSRAFRTLDTRAGAPAAFVSKSADTGVGIDGKAVIRDSVVLDGTVNPDFSQIESDQPQITVNKPFEVFFPEKRPFFLENATYFATPIQLLFTRRIADPLVGGRATGRVGRYAVGAMVIDDRSPFDGAAEDARARLAVGRVIRDVGRESYVGAFVSNRSGDVNANTVAAADGRIKLGSNWFATGQAAVTRSESTPGTRGTGLFASIVGAGRRFNYELDYNDRTPAFRASDGFVPRVDIRSVDQSYSFLARPRAGALQAWGPYFSMNRTWDHEGRPLDWSATPKFELQFPGTTTLDVYYTAARQTLRPGEVDVVSTFVVTDVSRAGVSFTSSILPRVIGSATFFTGDAANLTPVHGVVPPSGSIADATFTATIRLSRSLMVDLSYLYDNLRAAASHRPIFTNNITRIRVGNQFTRALAVRAIMQYNLLSVDGDQTTLRPTRNLNYDVLVTYLTSPGTAVYLGANYNLANLDPTLAPTGVLTSPALHNTGWQVFTKMSYLFRR